MDTSFKKPNKPGHSLILLINDPVAIGVIYTLVYFGFFILSSNIFFSQLSAFGLFSDDIITKFKFIILLFSLIYVWWLGLRKISAGGKCPSTLKQSANLKGYNVLITGGNSGIGKASLIQYIKWKANVIIGCRDTIKAEKIVSKLMTEGIITDPKQVEILHLDLADCDSVYRFCSFIKNKNIPINILLNNAGVMIPKGHVQLTNNLMELLTRSNCRVLNVSSLAHCFCNPNEVKKIEANDLTRNGAKNIKFSNFYALSKLLNIFYTYELQQRFSSDKTTLATAYSIHPGAVKTDILRDLTRNIINRLIFTIFMVPFLKSEEEGAETQLYLSVAPSKELIPGAYYADCKIGRVTNLALDSQVEKKFQDITKYFLAHEKKSF